MRKIWVTMVGWVLVIAGVAALALPGPGLLLLLAGMVVLSQEYDWAERRVEPVKEKAFDVAKAGVTTYPRILFSALAALLVMAVGVVWWMNDVTIPRIGPFGPGLPLGGPSTGSGIIVSGFVALALLVYSIRRFRPEALAERDKTLDARRA
ncbi:MAG: PGPGW domain-containing protein [Nocardioidaceae bacterium]